MDKKVFMAQIKSLYGGSFKQSQVEGIDAILDEAEKRRTPRRWLAYMFATAYHETGKTMQPVRETFADTDDKAIARLEKAFKDGKLPWVKTPYWRKDANGKSWLGRGLVQLTHKDNYDKFGIINPTDAMVMATAIKIMFDGMEHGAFTGAKLSDFLNRPTPDYVNARKIINGLERAALVAGYATEFESDLAASGYNWGTVAATQPTTPPPVPLSPTARPPATPMPTQTTGSQPGGWLATQLSKITQAFKGK